MGKWTQTYYDDVLSSKLKNLVSGAINRSSLEQGEPTISYERFVEALDEGDSFTATIIDILVKEIAERRTRQNAAHQHLIAERTSKALRLLGAQRGVYRNTSAPRTLPLSEYMNSPTEDINALDDDDDDFGAVLDGASSGSALALYDAYVNPPVVMSSTLHPADEPATEAAGSTDETDSYHALLARWRSHPPRSPVTRRPERLGNSSATDLSRQHSIRRPTRSRLMDFNEFTTRRRSETRDGVADASTPGDARELSHTAGNAFRGGLRLPRLSPYSHPRRDEIHGPYAWPQGPSNPATSAEFVETLPAPPTIGLTASLSRRSSSGTFVPASWLRPPSAPITPFRPLVASSGDGTEDISAPVDARSWSTLPRLRRGGVRAPEAIYSRQLLSTDGDLAGEGSSTPDHDPW